eukprot:CAMPEP_0115188212 /NCGR_PEP_ID=MMETSP0270-20121206/10893_1 /TAXON_ID=71861 /ORGANISM="Scrippsiella trochoidea, Strain CCMP3099" /LENGTH=402 /DNA_ID=CAMNT_0002601385 /DNA_START=53 /DNA_END=1262 /DNA_ORIENTATION=-
MVPVGTSSSAAGIGIVLPPSVLADSAIVPKTMASIHRLGAVGDRKAWRRSEVVLATVGSMSLAHLAARHKRAVGWPRARRSRAHTTRFAVSDGAMRQDGEKGVRRLLLEERPTKIAEFRKAAEDDHMTTKVKASELDGKVKGFVGGQGSMTSPVQTELAAIQGYWEEINTGLTIHVVDGEVDFHDGQGKRKLTESPDGLGLEGAMLAGGFPDLAVWRENGEDAMVWARAPHIENDPNFAATFHNFKLHRTILRTKLVQALADEDYKAAAGMQEVWQSTWGAGKQVTPQQELRLARGRFLVPGSCVRHKVFGFRGVVLGCEPWMKAPVLKMMARDESFNLDSPLQRLQPVYFCLADDRDVPGGGCTYALEKDLESAPEIYPLQSNFAENFLEAQDSSKATSQG